ncbi:hypothetical protein ISF_03914 [Cordyceps fumosorosea ARSEF 2679]|uniref:Rhomboid family membrane protein n=1 Tax=Cordyceps fumosorosea (strain ARSEF 2679) TaxID=1081104 RepID=A0A167YAQ2_CORFA|nr:hypothetical protein ISF_03914 [Cordyceps fumosorosea ARSEF 2679]OAA66076.1 hypothetical protein ISF_03914 [Cordyceps fumosorosea ARSEF 2679]
MATTTAQPEPPQRPPVHNPLIDNVALVFAVGTPLIMLMPPRKMDLRFFALAATFSLSTNHLCKSYTGESIYSRFNNRVSSAFDNGLPESAQRTQRLLKEHKEREAAAKGLPPPGQDKVGSNILKDIWMGGEKEDWKEKRAEEHQRSFEEGKGMSDIIMEQIADVFSGNWGSTKKNHESESTKQDDLDKGKK